jgi:ribosome-associated protein
MPRSDQTTAPPRRDGKRRNADTATADSPGAAALDDVAPLSKTRRKAAMHDLQDLGETLVGLNAARRAQLDLPERLDNAIADAQSITKWEARRRQMQFIGKLMRDVDPEPIRERIAQWSSAPAAEKVRLANVERWRERLLAGGDALAALAVAMPDADRSQIAALVARAQAERAGNQPPHAFRELFRLLNATVRAPAIAAPPGDDDDD